MVTGRPDTEPQRQERPLHGKGEAQNAPRRPQAERERSSPSTWWKLRDMLSTSTPRSSGPFTAHSTAPLPPLPQQRPGPLRRCPRPSGAGGAPGRGGACCSPARAIAPPAGLHFPAGVAAAPAAAGEGKWRRRQRRRREDAAGPGAGRVSPTPGVPPPHPSPAGGGPSPVTREAGRRRRGRAGTAPQQRGRRAVGLRCDTRPQGVAGPVSGCRASHGNHPELGGGGGL